MHCKLLEYDDIGSNKKKRLERELNTACEQLKDETVKRKLINATRIINRLYEITNSL